MLALLLAIIVLQACINGLLDRKREHNFEHNMQILKEYQQWEHRKAEAEANFQKIMHKLDKIEKSRQTAQERLEQEVK